ncbi:MAG: hypothetical protein QW035_03295 [Candidatus Anstonellales archaeon]
MIVVDALGLLVFSEESTKKAAEVPIPIALVLLSASSLIFSLPADLTIFNLVVNFTASTAFLAIMAVLLYALLKALGSEIIPAQLLSCCSVTLFLVSLSVFILVLVLIALGSLTGLTNVLLSSAASLFTTYYPTVVFAYSIDSSSNLKGIKGIIAGAFALFLFLLYQYLLLLLS